MATDSKQVKITFVAQDNTSQAIAKIDQIVDKFGKTVNKATKANNDLKNALKGIDNSAGKASRAFDELNAEAQKYATNLVKSVNQQKIYIKNLIAIRDATEITSKEHTRMSAEVQKLTNSLTQFQRGGTKLTKVNGDMQSLVLSKKIPVSLDPILILPDNELICPSIGLLTSSCLNCINTPSEPLRSK